MIPNINLLPTYERQSVVLYRVFIIGLIVVLLTFVGLTYAYFYAKTNISKADDAHEELVLQQELLETKLANAGGSQPESLESAIRFAEGYVITSSILIEEFVDLLPKDAAINTYDYNLGSVAIESAFETKNDISTYVVRLLESDYINDLKIDHIEPEVDDNNGPEQVNYSFDIHLAKLKEEAGSNE